MHTHIYIFYFKKKMTTLWDAAVLSTPDKLISCIRDGEDINKTNDRGETAFLLACRHNRRHVAHYLANLPEVDVNIGPDILIYMVYVLDITVLRSIAPRIRIDRSNIDPIFAIIDFTVDSKIISIMDMGIPFNINAVNKFGDSVLMFAARKSRVDLVRFLLLTTNVDPTYINPVTGKTIIDVMTPACYIQSIMKYFVLRGAAVTSVFPIIEYINSSDPDKSIIWELIRRLTPAHHHLHYIQKIPTLSKTIRTVAHAYLDPTDPIIDRSLRHNAAIVRDLFLRGKYFASIPTESWTPRRHPFFYSPVFHLFIKSICIAWCKCPDDMYLPAEMWHTIFSYIDRKWFPPVALPIISFK